MGGTLVVTGNAAANQTAGNATTAGAAANQTAGNATTAGAAEIKQQATLPLQAQRPIKQQATLPLQARRANQTAGNATTAGAAARSNSSKLSCGSPLVTSVSIVNGASVPTNEEFFTPDVTRITAGSVVTWKNDDTASHTVTSGTVRTTRLRLMETLIPGILNAGDSFQFAFDKAR